MPRATRPGYPALGGGDGVGARRGHRGHPARVLLHGGARPRLAGSTVPIGPHVRPAGRHRRQRGVVVHGAGAPRQDVRPRPPRASRAARPRGAAPRREGRRDRGEPANQPWRGPGAHRGDPREGRSRRAPGPRPLSARPVGCRAARARPAGATVTFGRTGWPRAPVAGAVIGAVATALVAAAIVTTRDSPPPPDSPELAARTSPLEPAVLRYDMLGVTGTADAPGGYAFLKTAGALSSAVDNSTLARGTPAG